MVTLHPEGSLCSRAVSELQRDFVLPSGLGRVGMLSPQTLLYRTARGHPEAAKVWDPAKGVGSVSVFILGVCQMCVNKVLLTKCVVLRCE